MNTSVKQTKKKAEQEDKPTVNQTMETVSVFKPDFRLALLCAFVGFVLYANTLTHDYVLDDKGVITQNEFVMQGFKGIKSIFTSDVWHSRNMSLGYYRPLSLATFAIENQLFPGNAMVSHFANVLLYALTGFFLCLLLMRFFSNYHPVFSLISTLLFLAHPIHTEVVANIKSRDEILSFLNLIVAIYFSLHVFTNKKANWLKVILSLLFFYLALLSKETAMAGVLLLPIILYFKKEFSLKQILYLTLPFALVILLFQFQKYEVFGSLSPPIIKDVMNYPYTDADTKLPSVLIVFAWCVKLILVPYPLTYSYAFNQIPAAQWTSLGAIAGLLFTAGVLYCVYNFIRKRTLPDFGILLFAVTLAPALAFVFLKGGILAERFLYAPVLGFSIVITSLLFSLFKLPVQQKDWSFALLMKEKKLSFLFLLLFGLYAAETFSRNTDWKNDFALFSHDVKVAGNSCQTHLHYGTILIQKGLEQQDDAQRKLFFDEGTVELYEAIQINRHSAEAFSQLGVAYQYLQLNFDSAVLNYNQAIMEGSDDPLCYIGLASLYEQTAKQELASYYFNKGAEANPFYQEGIALRDGHRKKTGLDIHQFPSSANIDTAETAGTVKDFNFYDKLGKEYGQKGDYENALRCMERAVKFKPASEEARINLAVCYGMTKRFEKSIEELNRVLVMNPQNTMALTNLIVMYDHVGMHDKADDCRRKLKGIGN